MTAVQRIYEPAVLHGTATFEEVPPTVEVMQSRRAAIEARGFPYLVAEVDGRVVGYAYANLYRERPAYRFTVENSVYVDPNLHRHGVGRALLEALIAACERTPVRQMIAVIGDSANQASVELHAACGFRHVGTLSSVGWKFGRWIDTVLMQRPIGEGDRHAATERAGSGASLTDPGPPPTFARR